MSLIAEALRKAHLDAQRQEATERGRAAYVAAAGRSAHRRSTTPWIAALVASNLLIAVLAVGAFRWSGGGPEAEEAVPRPAAPAIGTASAPARAAEPPPAPAVPEPPAAEPAAEPAPAPAAEPAGLTPPPAPAAVPERPPTARPAEARPEGPATPDGAVRVGSNAVLPGGHRVVLSGIVATPMGNRAMINDRLVRVGDSVEGYEVVRIERSGVELRGTGGRFYLDAP